MEMIAMLGGLGAGPYLENPSPAARAASNAISMSKTLDELAAIKTGLPNMGLSKDEEMVLSIMIDKRVEYLQRPSIFKNHWFWIGVVVVGGAAWYHRDKIKRAVGLDGLGGTPEEHRPRMEKALAAGRQHLTEFHEALDKKHACRSGGRTSGADEKLFDAIGSLARAVREAEHAGITRSTNQALNQALVDLDGNVDAAQIEFSRRCVVTEPLDVRPMVPESLIRR